MPVGSFVAEPVHDWTQSEVRAPAPPKKPGGPKLSKPKKPKRKARPLTPQMLAVLCARLEDALQDGRIALNPEDMPCESLDLTRGELVLLIQILWPDPEEQAEHLAEKKLAKMERKRRTAGTQS